MAATWMPDDVWTTTLAMNSYSNDIPLRGRLNEGVDGADIKIDVNYRFHESRQLSAGAQYIDMSDGNERVSAFADMSQRLKSSPGYTLEGNLGFYGSNNSRINAPYFNPTRDSSAAVTLTNAWLVERKAKRQFSHRLGLSAGVYNQEGFGSGELWSVRYQHDWVIGDTLVLNYGIAHTRHPYDGVQENENRLSLMVDWRF